MKCLGKVQCSRGFWLILVMCAHVQKDNPTHAEVDEVHGRVTEAVRQLYERHRELLPGHADRHLAVV